MAEQQNPKPAAQGNPNKIVRPTGKPQDWNAQEVARRAEVTDEDKLAGVSHWETNAPAPVKEILRASVRKRDESV